MAQQDNSRDLSAFFEPTRATLVDYTEVRTVKQMAQEAPFLTEGKLRWWIFYADTYGLSPAIIKIGGRVYIDRTAFNSWLESRRLAANATSDDA